MNNSDKIILDLCGGTGAWSRWYRSNGYCVYVITSPSFDILMTNLTMRGVIYFNGPKGEEIRIEIKDVYGILCAVPCTQFASSGARWWADKPPKLFQDALWLTAKCMEIIIISNPVFWCVENPVGRLRNVLGPPVMYFNPCDYGDPWTKKTCLWGNFNKPKKNPTKPTEGSKLHKLPLSTDRAALRSITPPRFTKAFFEANK